MNKMNTKSPKRYQATDRMSYIYKTTFEDGTTHFGRINASKGYSPKTYINDWYSHWKHNIHNPKRFSMITEFERRVAAERATLKCEIVFFGTTEECRVEKDRLVRTTDKCMNTKSSLTDTLGKIGKATTVRLKADKVKTITSTADGSKMYFIDREYGYLRGLKDNMIGKKHPLNPNFIQIVGLNIEKI
jgi:hypothetical protein